MLSLSELPQKNTDLAEMQSGPLGRCSHFFWLGVAFDAVGVAVLFTGVFANLLFYDMLLYLGSIIIFVSLLWWISWYTGNIEALPEDPLRGTSPRESGVHRSGSRRFSLTLRSVSDTFQRIRRRRRRRLHPRVVQRISSISSTDPGQLERNCDARTSGGRALFRSAKPEAVLNQFSRVQTSKSLPLGIVHTGLSICTSRSQPVFSVTSQTYPLASDSNSQMAMSSDSHVYLDSHSQEHSKISVASQIYPLEREESQSHLLVIPDSLSMVPVTSQSQILPSVSSESCVPLGPHSQGRSKISVASQIYPLEQEESQSHFLVPMPSDSFPVVPMTSQSQIQGSLAQQSHLQNLPLASQTPETDKASKSHTLAKGVPGVPPGSAQTQHPQASLAQTSQISSPVRKVPKN